MNWRAVFTIYRKEILDFIRDRRTVISLFVLPIFIAPAMIIGMDKFMSQTEKSAKEKLLTGAVKNDGSLPGLEDVLKQAGFRVKQDTNPLEAAKTKRADFGVEEVTQNGEKYLMLYLEFSGIEGSLSRRRIEGALDVYRSQVIRQNLASAGVPASVLSPFVIKSQNLAPPKKNEGEIFGGMVGMLVVLMMLSGSMYPAMDMTAGEKERKTMEALLSVAARREEIVLGKLLAIFSFSIIGATLSIVSFGFSIASTQHHGDPNANALAGALEPATASLLLITVLPVTLMLASMSLIICTMAKGTREAMSYFTPAMFTCMILCMVTYVPGLKATAAMALIPLANFSLLMKQLLSGDKPGTFFAITIAVNLVYAGLAYLAAVYCFKREEILFRT